MIWERKEELTGLRNIYLLGTISVLHSILTTLQEVSVIIFNCFQLLITDKET